MLNNFVYVKILFVFRGRLRRLHVSIEFYMTLEAVSFWCSVSHNGSTGMWHSCLGFKHLRQKYLTSSCLNCLCNFRLDIFGVNVTLNTFKYKTFMFTCSCFHESLLVTYLKATIVITLQTFIFCYFIFIFYFWMFCFYMIL